MIDLINLFNENLFGQVIGFLAFLLSVIAFLYKKDKEFYMWLVLSQIIYGIHFLFMGLYSGAFVSFINFIRTYIALKYKHIGSFFYIFLFVYILIGYLTYENIYSLLPVLGSILGLIAFLIFSGIYGRILLLFATLCWLFYNFIGGSIGGFITELFIFIANLITIIRIILDRYKK